MVKALLGAFKHSKHKFSQKDLIQFIKKLAPCGKDAGIAYLKEYEGKLHELLAFLNTAGNKMALGVKKSKVEEAFLALLETDASKGEIETAITGVDNLIFTHILANNISKELFEVDKY
jgi:Holliday junction resolvase